MPDPMVHAVLLCYGFILVKSTVQSRKNGPKNETQNYEKFEIFENDQNIKITSEISVLNQNNFNLIAKFKYIDS